MEPLKRSNASGAPVLEERIDVETPEQVVFSYTIAGVGSRSAAALIDYAICGTLIFVIVALSIVTRVAGFVAGASGGSFEWMLAMIGIFFFAVFWGYYVLFEALADGQTPGKKAMGLRVVQDGGFSISFAASSVRNLVRVVDLLPGFYVIGMLSVVLSRSAKRLGDYAAGTIVVKERQLNIPVARNDRLGSGVAPLSAQLSDDEYALLDRYVARRNDLDEQRRVALDASMFARLGERLPPGSDLAIRLRKLHSAERALRARGIASRSDTGAAREQHAIVAASGERWRNFAASLTRVRSMGLSKMTEDEVADFVAQYREVSTDMARLRTASRGRESDSVFHVSRLVAAGHNLLYRRRQLLPLIIWRFLAASVPAEVRRSAPHIAVAAVLLFGPMVGMYAAVVSDPARAEDMMPAEMLDRASSALEREARGGGYLPEATADSRGPAFAGMIMTNNVQVSFLAFALGISAGIGTVYILLQNGAGIGAAFGLFENADALHLIMSFVGPHGYLELIAICIAGGAGLLIGSAFLLPGALTRREALVVNGRRSIRLVAAAGVMLIFAGIIEGYVSPLHLPLTTALLIGAATLVPMLLWFNAGRNSADHAPDEEFGYSEARAFNSK